MHKECITCFCFHASFIIQSSRETLKRQLASKDFHVIHFDTNIDDDQLPRAAKEGKDKRAKVITERFISQVASKCMDEAIVFLFLSGIQFPIKVGVVCVLILIVRVSPFH